MKFRTVAQKKGAINATGLAVPDAVVTALGSGKRAPVVVTVNGYADRSTVMEMVQAKP